jgi:hypothetical protein
VKVKERKEETQPCTTELEQRQPNCQGFTDTVPNSNNRTDHHKPRSQELLEIESPLHYALPTFKHWSPPSARQSMPSRIASCAAHVVCDVRSVCLPEVAPRESEGSSSGVLHQDLPQSLHTHAHTYLESAFVPLREKGSSHATHIPCSPDRALSGRMAAQRMFAVSMRPQRMKRLCDRT